MIRNKERINTNQTILSCFPHVKISTKYIESTNSLTRSSVFAHARNI